MEGTPHLENATGKILDHNLFLDHALLCTGKTMLLDGNPFLYTAQNISFQMENLGISCLKTKLRMLVGLQA